MMILKKDYCRKMQVDERVTKEDKETFTKFFRKGKVGGSQIALPYNYFKKINFRKETTRPTSPRSWTPASAAG